MSEQDLRKILNDVIADLDSGRALPPRRGRLARLGVGLGAPAALAIGLTLGGCEWPVAAYGVPPADAAQDSGTRDGGLDDGAVVEYGGPDVDGSVDANLDDGAVIEYGGPDVDGSVDASVDASLDASLDDGAVVDYGVPPVDGGDGGQ